MMPRTLTSAEQEALRMDELRADRRTPLEKAAATHQQPQVGEVKLFHPDYEALKFGPGSGPETSDQLIVFGVIEPHVAIVRADHPLLPALLKSEPVVVLKPGEKPGRTYACEECDQEFPSKALLSEHRKEAHAKAKSTKAAAPEA